MTASLATWQGSASAWILFLACLVAAPLLTWDAHRFWHGRHRIWDGPSEIWDPGGPAYWHGFTRSIPLIAGYVSLCFLPGLFGAAFSSSPHDALFAVCSLVAAATFFGFLPLVLGVFFFNRPRWCVPPHRRDEPGALAEFRAHRGTRPTAL